jgi:hypothetical protein
VAVVSPTAALRSVEVTWRPTLRYYQHRLDPLEKLEKEGRLDAFRINEHDIRARNSGMELWLRSTGVSIYALANVGNAEVLSLIGHVLDAVAPASLGHLHGNYWHVVPLDESADYDERRIDALDRWSGGLLTKAGGQDFAILMDGESAGRTWQCEFGIVTAEEAVERLAGKVGSRMPRHDVTLTVGADSLPPIGILVQSLWHGRFPTRDADHGRWIDGTINQIDMAAEILVDQLYGFITGRGEGSLAVAEGGEQ